MCGIAAIYAYTPSAPPVNPAELSRIRDQMQTRGPDGHGAWLSNNQRVGLAHRRLSVIDLSDAAAQPMQTPDGHVHITYNGEIYNYQALRSGLQDKGYQFTTRSDTEVLLHLYREEGENMVRHLRGMFAFAIWDEQKQGMLLARDPYGIKPLYYADDGNTLRIASQVKALLAGGQVPQEPDPAGMVGFYLLGSVPEPFTTYAAIRALPAGCTMWLTAAGPGQPRPFFSITDAWTQAQAEPAAPEEIQREVRQAMLDSVEHHLVADVPVAIFLSAGVDSGAILGLMRELAPEATIRAVTLVFEEYVGSQDDESPLAEKVAALYGAEHTRRTVTQAEFQEDLPAILAAMDQPSIDGINAWFISKAARELGIKVALSGLGGDELFGGYPSFRDVPRWQRYLRLPSKLPLLGKAVRTLAAGMLANSKYAKAAGMIEYGGTAAGAWLLRRGIFMPWELQSLLPAELVAAGMQRLQPLAAIESTMDASKNASFANIARMESALYMRNQLLRDADWAGMAHSVELRVPLVDVRLLQRLAPLLLAQERIEGKQWLARSPRCALPGEIVARNKTGFTTPIHYWMKSTLQGDAKTLGGSAANHGNEHWSRSWARFVIGAGASVTPVTLLRDFREDKRTSMEHYADQLFTSLNTNESKAFGIAQYQPRLGNFTRQLPQAANLQMRFARYVGYPWQARKIDSGIYHIIDHGYAHLLQVIDPGRAVITVHDIIPLLAGRGLIPGMQMRRQSLAEYSFSWLKRAARLIAVSENTRSDIIEHCGCDPEKVDVVYQGLGDEFVPLTGESKESLRRSLGLPADDRKLVLVTGSAHYKNHPTSLKILQKLHAQHGDELALVHLGGERAVWKSALAESGYNRPVIELTGLGKEQLVRLYNAVDCLLFPSWYEGFGWPPLEAMACGTPAVTSNRASLPEIMGSVGPTFEAADVDGMAACLGRLLFEPGYRQEQVDRGIAHAAKFSWDRASREVTNVYHKLRERQAA